MREGEAGRKEEERIQNQKQKPVLLSVALYASSLAQGALREVAPVGRKWMLCSRCGEAKVLEAAAGHHR